MKASCVLFILALLVIAGCDKKEPTKPVKEEPTITLTSPADGDPVVDTVLITATASDNKGVVKVEFYIDAALRHTDLLEPYEYAWYCMEEEDSSQHTIYAKAYDGDGHATASAVVTVTVDYSYGPPSPASLSYVVPSHTDSTVLRLGWTESGAVDFNSYRVYRSLTAGVTEASDLVTEILQRTTTTYEDSGLITGQTYYYRVFVYDNDTLSAGSNELSGTPKGIGAGYALKFDGVDDFVEIPSNDVFDFSLVKMFTIEFWTKVTAFPSVESFIIDKWGTGSDEDDEWIFKVHSDKKYSLTINSSSYPGSPNTTLWGSTLLETGRWYHIAGVWDGNNHIAELYLDGGLDAVDSLAIETILYTNEPIRVGRPAWSYDFYNGIIDELRIWNVTRPQAQIQATMHSRLTGSETGLVGYWTFDEGKNQLAADYSGNGNNGQLGSTSGIDFDDPTWIVSDAPIY